MAASGINGHFVKPYHVGSRVAEYVARHNSPLHPALAKLCQETQKQPIPQKMADTSQLQFFQILLKATKARHYLDIGVFTGASALAAALALPPDGRVIGLDIDEDVVKVGRPFWKEAGVEDKIDIVIGDASKSLDDLIAQGKSNFFDFIFIDADKESMDDYYEKSLQLVRRQGIIAVDNETQKQPHPDRMSDTSQLQFFQILLKATKAKNYLDIGVFTGTSALAAALALPPDGHVVGVEIDEEIVNVGRPFWREAGVEDKIDIVIGDAKKSLDDLIAQGKSNFFDFVFIDADKKSIDEYYEKSLQLVRRHGIIAVDNVLWQARAYNPEFNDPVTESVRRLNRKMASDDRVEISMLTVSDGVTLVLKK